MGNSPMNGADLRYLDVRYIPSEVYHTALMQHKGVKKATAVDYLICVFEQKDRIANNYHFLVRFLLKHYNVEKVGFRHFKYMRKSMIPILNLSIRAYTPNLFRIFYNTAKVTHFSNMNKEIWRTVRVR